MRHFPYPHLLRLGIAPDGLRNSGDGPEEEIERFDEHEDVGEHKLVSQHAGEKTSDNGFCGRIRPAPEPTKGKEQGTPEGQGGSKAQQTRLVKVVGQVVVPAPNSPFLPTAVGKVPVHSGIGSASWPIPEEQTLGRYRYLSPGNL